MGHMQPLSRDELMNYVTDRQTSCAGHRADTDYRVVDDGESEENVHHDQHQRVESTTSRVRVCHLGLDHQCQEVREKDHEASLGANDEREGFIAIGLLGSPCGSWV